MRRDRGDAAEAMRVKAPPVVADGDLFSPPVTHKVPVRATMRTVKGPPLPDGAQLKETALAGLAAGNADVIAWLREQLTALYYRRERKWSEHRLFGEPVQEPYVTADDVYTLLHDSPIWSDRLDGPQFWRASVWRKGFRKIQGRMVPSLRDDQHAALIQAWAPCD